MHWRYVSFGAHLAAFFAFASVCQAQTAPAPSQVAPPVVPPAPGGGARITLPQVPAGAKIPPGANKLTFKLTGFDIQDEYVELTAARRELAAPLVGRRVTVADIFDFADKLQQIYVRAGYPLARVVILPQEFDQSARIKMRVVDGFIERMDFESIAPPARTRVAAVLAPLVGKTHLTQGELERRLLIAGDAPGVILNATFAGGKEVGGSVLVLSGRYRPVSASIYTDNSLPASFGTGQLVTTASLNTLLGFGEQLTISAAGLPDENYTTAYPTRRYLSGSFALPIGIDGLRVELGATNGLTTPRVSTIAASQGLLSQGRAKLFYDLVKTRDFGLTAFGGLDATNEEIDTLAFTPQVPLSIDRTRVTRGGLDGVWRSRTTGTTVTFGGTYSRGLPGLGARRANEVDPLVPLSRAGADADFAKADGRIEINQSLPQDFFVSLTMFAQTSFGHPLLTSEQFDVTGAKMLSGFTAGSLAGDTSWALRSEIGRPVVLPISASGVGVTPYVFAATGERIFENPSALEIGSMHATNYGSGVRFNLSPWANWAPDGYGFIEWSHRQATDSRLDGERIFAGFLLRY